MRWLRAALPFLLAGLCLAADTSPVPVPALCSSVVGAPACPGTKQDLKAARKAFRHGLRLEKSKDLDGAFYEFGAAASLVPQNLEYLTAHEMMKQHLVGLHVQRGSADLQEGRAIEAMAEFRSALTLDPDNEFAQQRMQDALGAAPVRAPSPPRLVEKTDKIVAKPTEEMHDFHFRGDSRGLLNAIASSYGLSVTFDESFPNRRVRFDLDDASFSTAMKAASEVTKSFSMAVEEKVLFACADNAENHRLFDRMGLRSYYVPEGTPQDLNQVMNSLRTLFEFKFVSLNAASHIITVRGPQAVLDAATEFMGQLDNQEPEVMLDLKVFQVSHTYMHNIGLHVPDSFNLFNIPIAALGALGGQNIQQLINQLIASGGINDAGSQSISALIAQLQGQQNSIFSQPLATFGGGLTLMGLSLDKLAASLTMNESSVRQLSHVTLRASQQKDATFKLGERYPILNGSFAPIYNNAAISQVLGNQSYTAPFPSVSYEDIGLTLKAKPMIHGNLDVGLDLELQMRTLGPLSSDGIPNIFNREYKGGILLRNGERAVVAGMLTRSEQKSLNGLPLFSKIPGFGLLTAQNTRQEEDDELLILITPNVVRSPERAEPPEIWLGR